MNDNPIRKTSVSAGDNSYNNYNSNDNNDDDDFFLKVEDFISGKY